MILLISASQLAMIKVVSHLAWLSERDKEKGVRGGRKEGREGRREEDEQRMQVHNILISLSSY
jgi:hypothetical protein